MLRGLLLISMLAVVGCSDDTPTSPTPDSVDGVWRIISIQPASQAVQTAPTGASSCARLHAGGGRDGGV